MGEGLTINKYKNTNYDYSWEISAAGRQTYYVIKGYAINKGDYVDLFLENVTEGVYLPEAQKAFHVYFKAD